jgi:hypothetical protein
MLALPAQAENKRLAEEEEAAIAARKDKLTVAGVSKVGKGGGAGVRERE